MPKPRQMAGVNSVVPSSRWSARAGLCIVVCVCVTRLTACSVCVCYGSTGTADANRVCVTGLRGRRVCVLRVYGDGGREQGT
eukprot:4630727-Prymnesium_polylepis.1